MQKLTREQEELIGKGYNYPPFAKENTAHIKTQVEFWSLFRPTLTCYAAETYPLISMSPLLLLILSSYIWTIIWSFSVHCKVFSSRSLYVFDYMPKWAQESALVSNKMSCLLRCPDLFRCGQNERIVLGLDELQLKMLKAEVSIVFKCIVPATGISMKKSKAPGF